MSNAAGENMPDSVTRAAIAETRARIRSRSRQTPVLAVAGLDLGLPQGMLSPKLD